jgi:serine/threonine-protein kinase
VTADVDRPAPIGETVGNYRILRKLSTGGMGTVYYAEHTLIGRSAAVKVLHPELSGSKEIVNRFFNEAKATTSIKHPGIVEVFDYGYLASGDGYLIMEFLEGMSLAHRLKAGVRYGEGEAAILVRGVCSALAAAHQKGIVHRDLKPDNIFLVDDPEAPIGERPKVLDFGIAKLTDIGLASAATKTGAVMGTPTYMSPEQCRGTGDVDHRADLYSLGCILYELSCGRPPFKALGAGELIGAHQHLKPSPPSKHNPNISPDMEALIVSLLDKDPACRVQSAPELGRLLAKIAIKHGYQVTMTNVTPTPGVSRLPAASTNELASSFSEIIDATTTDEPTTLGHSAAQRLSRPRSRWRFVPAFAVLAAAVIAVLTITAYDTDGEATAVTPAQAPPPPVTPPPPPPPEVTETVEQAIAPPAVDVTPAVIEPVAPPPPPKPTKRPVRTKRKPPAKPPESVPEPNTVGPIETDI